MERKQNRCIVLLAVCLICIIGLCAACSTRSKPESDVQSRLPAETGSAEISSAAQGSELSEAASAVLSFVSSAVQNSSTAQSSSVRGSHVQSGTASKTPTGSVHSTGSTRPSAPASTSKVTSAAPSAPSSHVSSTVSQAPPKTAAARLQTMSLPEKVWQLFVVRPEGLDKNLTTGTKYTEAQLAALCKKYPVGGVCFFGNNISNPSQITKLTAALRSGSAITPFLTVDEEGGRVARIAGNRNFSVPKYESMLAIGKTGDINQAYNVGKTIGGYLKKYGFNVDFAPVADVFTNPQNTVIGDRSFGSDPQLVARMVTAELNGLHAAKMMGCVKHFPGHGDTKGDTHTGTVSVIKTWDQLKQCELIPFSAAISAGTDMVMVAHIHTPNITADGLPATLSYEMITNRLRKELGYRGVVVTDALEMGAIKGNYTDAALKAFAAGADLLLLPGDLNSAYNSIYHAVANGKISQQRLDESVLRILKLKEKYGMLA